MIAQRRRDIRSCFENPHQQNQDVWLYLLGHQHKTVERRVMNAFLMEPNLGASITSLGSRRRRISIPGRVIRTYAHEAKQKITADSSALGCSRYQALFRLARARVHR